MRRRWVRSRPIMIRWAILGGRGRRLGVRLKRTGVRRGRGRGWCTVWRPQTGAFSHPAVISQCSGKREGKTHVYLSIIGFCFAKFIRLFDNQRCVLEASFFRPGPDSIGHFGSGYFSHRVLEIDFSGCGTNWFFEISAKNVKSYVPY